MNRPATPAETQNGIGWLIGRRNRSTESASS
jgi:hypothetical protein